MARRQIGQERLVTDGAGPRGGTSLDEVAALVDWTEIDGLLAGISSSAKGEPGWPPLALFRAPPGCHLARPVRRAPGRSTGRPRQLPPVLRLCRWRAHARAYRLVRFRHALVRDELDRILFGTVTRQLDARGVVVRTGTLVDATLIASASVGHDKEAQWAGHRRRKPTHGYKAHVTTDQDAWLIRGIEVTAANVHDAAELDAILPGSAGDTYGDSGVVRLAGPVGPWHRARHDGAQSLPRLPLPGRGGRARGLALQLPQPQPARRRDHPGRSRRGGVLREHSRVGPASAGYSPTR